MLAGLFSPRFKTMVSLLIGSNTFFSINRGLIEDIAAISILILILMTLHYFL